MGFLNSSTLCAAFCLFYSVIGNGQEVRGCFGFQYICSSIHYSLFAGDGAANDLDRQGGHHDHSERARLHHRRRQPRLRTLQPEEVDRAEHRPTGGASVEVWLRLDLQMEVCLGLDSQTLCFWFTTATKNENYLLVSLLRVSVICLQRNAGIHNLLLAIPKYCR